MEPSNDGIRFSMSSFPIFLSFGRIWNGKVSTKMKNQRTFDLLDRSKRERKRESLTSQYNVKLSFCKYFPSFCINSSRNINSRQPHPSPTLNVRQFSTQPKNKQKKLSLEYILTNLRPI
ncbi:hypothetical protein BLOT_002922 [Blomia tropicalis]|nr:hypothetical protein BLOT_002922 [Blomia tropicalis]